MEQNADTVGADRPTPASIRFPRPLLERVRRVAEQEHRTFSGTVLHLVRTALDDADADSSDTDDAEIERLHALYVETVEKR
jgi:hypothetical protein